MSKVLSINRNGFGGFERVSSNHRKKLESNCSVLHMRGCKKSERVISENNEKTGIRIGGATSVVLFFVVFFGAFYLREVNSLATKGYEIKQIENKIVELKEINKKNKIHEMELRSMYNIENEMKDFNLVSSTNVTYLEVNDSVAMK
jgi:hypothetical protein